MKNPREIIDGFDGLLTKEQALALYYESIKEAIPKMPLSAEYASAFFTNSANGILTSLAKEKIDIQDKIYRIFNPVTKSFGENKAISQTVVLGREGFTVNISLNRKASKMLDSFKIERGDTVLFKSLSIDIKLLSLKSTPSTSIIKITNSNFGINDFSKIRSSMETVDLIGTLVEAEQIKHISKMSKLPVPVLKVLLSDGRKILRVTCWGSSALAIASIPLNHKVKIEYCKLKKSGDFIEIRADEMSRVLEL
jgi:hypothetical protein